eukprot:4607082-Pyramimonas_sp.AAC.1
MRIYNQARARAGALFSEELQPASRRERAEPFSAISSNYSLEMSIQRLQLDTSSQCIKNRALARFAHYLTTNRLLGWDCVSD